MIDIMDVRSHIKILNKRLEYFNMNHYIMNYSRSEELRLQTEINEISKAIDRCNSKMAKINAPIVFKVNDEEALHE